MDRVTLTGLEEVDLTQQAFGPVRDEDVSLEPIQELFSSSVITVGFQSECNGRAHMS